MSEPVTIALSRPIRMIDDMRTTITLNEPTGKQIAKAGYPLIFSADGVTEFNAASMSKMIAAIGNFTEEAVDRLPAYDWQNCALAVMGFFAPPENPKESSGATSSSPAGGAT